jgi:hypothetical protein
VEGVAESVSSVDELHPHLGTSTKRLEREHFFRAEAADNICETLSELSEKPR